MSGAFENLESIVSGHMFAGLLSLQTPQRGILISPKQRCGRVDLHVTAHARPPVVARQVGAVVVEPRGQAARPRQRADEMLDRAARHRLTKHAAQPPEVILGEHVLGFTLEQEEADVARPFLLILVLVRRLSEGRGMTNRKNC